MKKIAIYVDNSILDRLEKGRLSVDDFCREDVQLCYSVQNLEEIVQGSLYQGKVEVLQNADAKYLNFCEDDDGREQCVFEVKDIPVQTEEVMASFESSSLGMFGLQDLQQKLIGGLRHKENLSLVDQGTTDFSSMLHDLGEQMSEFFSPDEVSDWVAIKNSEFDVSIREAFDAIEGFSDSAHGYYEREFGIRAVELNNITGEFALERITEYVDGLGKAKNTPDLARHLFSSLPLKREHARKRNFTNFEVSLFSYAFNIIAYQRERKIVAKTERSRADFRADSWDIAHIANARHCCFFFTGDEKQALRAAAIYDHIGARCFVVCLQKDSENCKIIYAPEGIELREFS